MDENENNNKQYEDLKKEFEILKQENEKHKANIIYLNQQLKIMRDEHNEAIKEISGLKEKYKEQFQQLLNIITQKEQLNKEKNEIIIEKDDGIIDIKENHIKLDKKEIKKDNSLKKTPKGNNEKKEEYISYRVLFGLFETKLFKIFYDDNANIDENDINDLKKLSIAFLIKGKNPTDIVGEFVEKNLINNNVDQLEEDKKEKLGNKKSDIYLILEDIQTFKFNDSYLSNVDKKHIDEFIQDLREKCGITSEDINDKDLKKEIKNNKYDSKKIINTILKKTKLFQKND